jgi:threonine dehydratase
VLLVNTDAICAAIKDVFEDTRTVLEPAGALAVAGAKAWAAQSPERDRELVAITSGANMNFDRLRFVTERAEIGEAREALLAVRIPERPGSFRAFIRVLGERSVTEFNYRYADPGEAVVFVGIAVRHRAERAEVIAALNATGAAAQDLSDNETAKLHIRHMVGGRNPQLADERLFCFEFPERPGALRQFLQALQPDWNISLFHYRNQGGDIGRVLAGLQVPPTDAAAFAAFLEQLAFPAEEVTADPACRLFL